MLGSCATCANRSGHPGSDYSWAFLTSSAGDKKNLAILSHTPTRESRSATRLGSSHIGLLVCQSLTPRVKFRCWWLHCRGARPKPTLRSYEPQRTVKSSARGSAVRSTDDQCSPAPLRLPHPRSASVRPCCPGTG